MDTKQKFVLLFLAGLIILTIAGYFFLKEARMFMREKAKQEAMAAGFQEAKDIFGHFKKKIIEE